VLIVGLAPLGPGSVLMFWIVYSLFWGSIFLKLKVIVAFLTGRIPAL